MCVFIPRWGANAVSVIHILEFIKRDCSLDLIIEKMIYCSAGDCGYNIHFACKFKFPYLILSQIYYEVLRLDKLISIQKLINYSVSFELMQTPPASCPLCESITETKMYCAPLAPWVYFEFDEVILNKLIITQHLQVPYLGM